MKDTVKEREMKYSFMSFSAPQLSLDEMLATARRYGYDGVEPRLDANHAHGVEVATSADERAAVRRKAESAGVAIACLATSISYADPSKTDEMMKQTDERIDLADDVGAPVVRVFGGGIPEGMSREEAIALLADSLGSVSGHAAEHGVTLCLETHDDWCDPAHVAEVLSRVNHPNIACNWDIMHPVRTKNATIDESFETLKPWIGHLHIHDGVGEGVQLVPIGQGEIDHRRAVELLLGIGYRGFVSGEWIGWEPYEVHLPRELATLKEYERSA